ncbi:MAG TPA: 6-pyruvoyl-tetrahydropterin synthase-related protein [Acidimicrobiales bacterium]|nr:6-pyruvoyl-tetrahydropterin synthase-related protein [Acidimicrobiales bacterium]
MRRPAAPSIITFGAVGGVIAVVLWQLHPSLLLANTTITGGDTGAHVGLAGFLKSNLLPHGHVTGWDPGAYDGFPLNTLYFPLPDFIAAAVGYVIPFNVAFKLVTILGSLTLPVAAWLFGRLSGLERPRPAVLAIFTLPFLFEQSFQIYGGNLYSTMAGEYAFSLGLSFALVFLGLAVRGMKTGRFRASTAVVLAICILCHLLTALFALAGAVVIFLLAGPTRRRLWWMVASVGGGLLLASWWIVPFALDQAYSTNMGWLNVSTYVSVLFPGGDLWAIVLAGMGTVVAIVVAVTRRQSAPLLLAVLGVTAALVVRFDPQWTLYNVRFLPFYMFCVYLLAGYVVAEAGVAVATGVRRLRLALWRDAVAAALAPAVPTEGATETAEPRVPSEVGTVDPARVAWPRPRFGPWAPGAVTVPIVSMLAVLAVVLPPLVPRLDSDVGGALHHQFSPSSVASWAQWNYSGYQNTPGAKELYEGIIPTMQEVGRRHGCGRAMWEYNVNLNRFGTPESLMLLPYWTNNCIDSIEGVLFESSATTPYHFINQAELSQSPSEAVVSETTGIQYGPLDVALGVRHLQLLGIKYFMASSAAVQAQADVDPALSLVATTGPWRAAYGGSELATTWKIYEVHDASLVTPLTRTPDVLTATAAGQGSWLPVAQKWYADPARWDQQLVAEGPASWARTATPSSAPAGRRLPAVHVSQVKVGIDTLSFHVDRTGVPVVVGVSYFPNWRVTGASGPWRAEPNLMVVDPTSHTVTLTYGSTGADHAGLVLTLVGLLVVAEMVRRRSLVAGWSPLRPLTRRRQGRQR